MVPEQKSLSEARLLLEPRIRSSKCVGGLQRKTTTHAVGCGMKRYGAVIPLQPSLMPLKSSVIPPTAGENRSQRFIERDPCPELTLPASSLREHLLSLWNDKFRVRSLAVEDVLFLLSHPDVAHTLESASFLREVGVSYHQVMQLETALTSLRQQEGRVYSSKPLPRSTRNIPSLCHVLAQNMWIHGRAFVATRSISSTLPEVISRKKLPPRAAKLPFKQVKSLSPEFPNTQTSEGSPLENAAARVRISSR
jgi:hypothetical protein